MSSNPHIDDLSFDEIDELISPRAEETDFDHIVETALSRRGFLGGVMTFGLGTFLVGSTALTRDALADGHADRFGFTQVTANSEDTITVPEGFEWEQVVTWGDPLFSDAPAFDDATRGTAASQALAFGDNNDGMSIFTKDGRTVMAINNEYTNRKILWGNNPDGKWVSDDDLQKGMNAHGVSVFEVARDESGKWQVVVDSDLNRRITPQTDMDLTGPAAGHDLLKTKADPTGTTTKGTWNNCGNGETPWGTYLTCEENFNGYFSAEDEAHEVSAELKRYGASSKDWGYGGPKWTTALTSPRTQMSQTVQAMWSKSIHLTQPPRQRNAPLWAASNMKTPPWFWRPTAKRLSTSATMNAVSSSTGLSLTVFTPPPAITAIFWKMATCLWPNSMTTCAANGWP